MLPLSDHPIRLGGEEGQRPSVGDVPRASLLGKETQVDKKADNPLTVSERRAIENLKKTQRDVNELSRAKQPEFVKGTIEPTTKK